jgi:hypothetical protein
MIGRVIVYTVWLTDSPHFFSLGWEQRRRMFWPDDWPSPGCMTHWLTSLFLHGLRPKSENVLAKWLAKSLRTHLLYDSLTHLIIPWPSPGCMTHWLTSLFLRGSSAKKENVLARWLAESCLYDSLTHLIIPSWVEPKEWECFSQMISWALPIWLTDSPHYSSMGWVQRRRMF